LLVGFVSTLGGLTALNGGWLLEPGLLVVGALFTRPLAARHMTNAKKSIKAGIY